MILLLIYQEFKVFHLVKLLLINPEYNSVVPNLGYTGELSFDCYKGLYFYLAPDECYPEECGDNKCPQKNKTCLSY